MIDHNSCFEAIVFYQVKIQFLKCGNIHIYTVGPNGWEAAISLHWVNNTYSQN